MTLKSRKQQIGLKNWPGEERADSQPGPHLPPSLTPLVRALPQHSLHFPGLLELVVTMAVMAGKTDRVTVKTNTRHSAVSQIWEPEAGV